MKLFGLFRDTDQLFYIVGNTFRCSHRFEVHFKSVDMWVGVFWDRDLSVLWICPIPMLAIRIMFRRTK